MRDETAYDPRTKTIPRRNPLPREFKQGQIDSDLGVYSGTPDDLIWANNPLGYPRGRFVRPPKMPLYKRYSGPKAVGEGPQGYPYVTSLSNAAKQTFYLGGSTPNSGNAPGLGAMNQDTGADLVVIVAGLLLGWLAFGKRK